MEEDAGANARREDRGERRAVSATAGQLGARRSPLCCANSTRGAACAWNIRAAPDVRAKLSKRDCQSDTKILDGTRANGRRDMTTEGPGVSVKRFLTGGRSLSQRDTFRHFDIHPFTHPRIHCQSCSDGESHPFTPLSFRFTSFLANGEEVGEEKERMGNGKRGSRARPVRRVFPLIRDRANKVGARDSQNARADEFGSRRFSQ